MSKMNVAVIFGGKSTEHEISCISANQVIQALDKQKYEVIPIYISKDNDFYFGDKLFDIANYADIVSKPDENLEKIVIYKDGNNVYCRPINGLFKKAVKIDVAFPVVHGTNVEDGSLAGYLQMLDLPFTSCDVLGGAIGQDKAVMKDVFKSQDIPMVDYFVIYGNEFNNSSVDYLKKAEEIGFPLICKPANLGSSIGIEVINNIDEFKEKVDECLKYDFKVVVEKMIKDLKEVNIAVLGTNQKVKLSVIEEVSNGFLDYDKKYHPDGSKSGSKNGNKITKISGKVSKGMASTERKVPADLADEQKEDIEKIASKVFRILNAFGCVRIDFMIDNQDGKVYCNEINTIPGSLAFYLWDAAGLQFDKECDEMIQNAIVRYASKAKKIYSFDTNILENYKKK